MFLRLLSAAAALFLCAFFSARFLIAVPAHDGEAGANAGSGWTFQLAPVSLGNPATAATLKVRPETLAADTPAPATTGPFRYDLPIRAERGDTLAGMLAAAGIDNQEAALAIAALRDVFDPRRIMPGQEINLTFETDPEKDNQPGTFLGLSLEPDFSRRVLVSRTPDSGFSAKEAERPFTRGVGVTADTINNSLFVDGTRAGAPAEVLIEMIRLFSWDVDFQRDVWPGDSFELMYENIRDERGDVVKNGDILFASLTLSGERHTMYRFKGDGGIVEYFDDKGQSARKALLRTPIDGARLSSGFGNRRHPILGYTRKHAGVDFAAPPGTPIYAAGDGRIDIAGWHGGYGKYVAIRHTSDYSTAYGHMSRIATGMSPGKRVRQGQIIGYVGSTGQSTGPHLHYEIHIKGRPTDPLKVRMPSGRQLAGRELKRFLAAKADIEKQYAANDNEIASTDN